MRKLLFIALAAGLAGCAAPNTGPIAVGDQFMLSKFGSMTTFSGSQVKAELYADATAFCAKTGKKLVPVSSTSEDSGLAKYASAEIQFRCA